MMMKAISLLLLLLASLHCSWASIPTRCFEPFQCKDARVVQVVADVTMAECSNICNDMYNCNFYVMNDATHLCSLYADCSDGEYCESCLFAKKECRLTECFIEKVSCATDNEPMETLEGVESIDECLEVCNEQLSDECSYFDFTFEPSDQTAMKYCSFFTTCPSPRPGRGVIASRAFCSIEDYKCFQPARCVGTEVRSLKATATECHRECVSSSECEWFEYENGVCSLLANCEYRVECPTCMLGHSTCSLPSPNRVVYVRSYEEGPHLQVDSLSTWEIDDLRLEQTQIPLNLHEIHASCLTKSGIAVLCESEACYYLDIVADKWATRSTHLNVSINSANAKCSVLDDDTVIISGVAGVNALTFKVDFDQPERVAQTTDVIDGRLGHCIVRLGDQDVFFVLGSSEGTYDAMLTNLKGGQITPITNPAIEQLKNFHRHECGVLSTPDSNEYTIVVAGPRVLDDRGSYVLKTDGIDFTAVEGPEFPGPLYRLQRIEGTEEVLMIGLSSEKRQWQVVKFTEDQGWIVVNHWDYYGNVEQATIGIAVAFVEERK